MFLSLWQKRVIACVSNKDLLGQLSRMKLTPEAVTLTAAALTSIEVEFPKTTAATFTTMSQDAMAI